ncbi:hypothetical protein C7U61_10450 [Rhizobium sp. JAB6]|nr:hypothetical protein C7U61_10450 [Rhizobium sp. JAB6]
MRLRNREIEHDVVRKPLTLFGTMLELARLSARGDFRRHGRYEQRASTSGRRAGHHSGRASDG